MVKEPAHKSSKLVQESANPMMETTTAVQVQSRTYSSGTELTHSQEGRLIACREVQVRVVAYSADEYVAYWVVAQEVVYGYAGYADNPEQAVRNLFDTIAAALASLGAYGEALLPGAAAGYRTLSRYFELDLQLQLEKGKACV